MTRTRWATMALAGGLCLTLCGCSVEENTTEPAPTATSAESSAGPAASATPEPAVTASPSKGSYGNNPQAPSDETAAPYPSMTWDASAAEEAKSTATKVMELFARPDVESTAWHKDIDPYLTDGAKADHASFDPSYLEITGVSKEGAKVDPGASPQRARVQVSMRPNGEVYKVDLVRMPDGTWAVDGITPGDLGQH